MAAQHPARASPELRAAPLSPRCRRNYTTPRGTTVRRIFKLEIQAFNGCAARYKFTP